MCLFTLRIAFVEQLIDCAIHASQPVHSDGARRTKVEMVAQRRCATHVQQPGPWRALACLNLLTGLIAAPS